MEGGCSALLMYTSACLYAQQVGSQLLVCGTKPGSVQHLCAFCGSSRAAQPFGAAVALCLAVELNRLVLQWAGGQVLHAHVVCMFHGSAVVMSISLASRSGRGCQAMW
ncbi:hypothetical protein COO60DRAFT_1522017 [Scenedesmus sp. NREL 46B-D3]|nr:hypothetical protein COO60DRAFT_1522017 [Scenedesmus sp. NREL 46B-D3]